MQVFSHQTENISPASEPIAQFYQHNGAPLQPYGTNRAAIIYAGSGEEAYPSTSLYNLRQNPPAKYIFHYSFFE